MSVLPITITQTSTKQSATVSPYLPPGGIPLMTGPLTTATTTLEKQQHYLLDEVKEKLEDLNKDENYELTKIQLFIWCFLSGIAGTLLVMYALGLTVLFESTKPHGPGANAAFALGVLCMTPCLCWFRYVYCPNKEQKEFRRLMHAKRRERVDEEARIVKEKLRLAHIEDEKKEAARKKLAEEEENYMNRKSTNRKSFN